MASASSSAGVRGKWGDTRYVPLRQIDPSTKANATNALNTPAKAKPVKKKFFSSKNDPKTPMKPSNRANGNISVCVRLRPTLDDNHEEEFVHVSPGEGNIFVTSEKCFHFDKVFDGARGRHGQEDFYLDSGISAAVADSVIEADRHTSVFAYGQTGTGKTYTMGTEWNNDKVSESSCLDLRSPFVL